MIKTLIFDFGDVFINLDKQGAMDFALETFGIEAFENDMLQTNSLFEKGMITTEEFISFYATKFPQLTTTNIIEAWNYIIRDFPKYRLDFLKELAKNTDYNLILLSNTNELHIKYIKEHLSFYDEFKSLFDKFYLSHEIQFRKPNADIFEYVLKENDINPSDCLFIDDTVENTITAASLGLQTWHIDPEKEDVIHLFKRCKSIF